MPKPLNNLISHNFINIHTLSLLLNTTWVKAGYNTLVCKKL